MGQETENRADVERQLADRRASIERRIDSLEDEIVSTPAAIKSSISKHPIVGIAGAVAAGLAVGLLVSLRKKRSGTRVAPLHQRLVEQYIDAVGDEVKRKTRRGKSAADAVRESLRDRSPLIVYSPRTSDPEEGERPGFLSQVGDVALKTALAFAVKTVIDVVTASLNIKELQQMLALEEEERQAARDGAGTAGDGAAETFEEPPGWEQSSTEP